MTDSPLRWGGWVVAKVAGMACRWGMDELATKHGAPGVTLLCCGTAVACAGGLTAACLHVLCFVAAGTAWLASSRKQLDLK
jgi:hypothetical protein